METFELNVKILADSINEATGDRLTTFLLPRYPKVLAQEILVHRALSRNSASSRAIPIKKVIENILADPYIPTFTRNIKGMQGVDDLSVKQIDDARSVWMRAMHEAIANAQRLMDIGVHKQESNRLLESFMRIPIIISATDWNNFFNLRTKDDVQPDFRDTSREMFTLYNQSTPKQLRVNEWHLPFINWHTSVDLKSALKISTARCARVSYLNHYGLIDLEADYSLHDRLLEDAHSSPLEHSARALPESTPCRNFKGWMQYRVHVEENIPLASNDQRHSAKNNGSTVC